MAIDIVYYAAHTYIYINIYMCVYIDPGLDFIHTGF